MPCILLSYYDRCERAVLFVHCHVFCLHREVILAMFCHAMCTSDYCGDLPWSVTFSLPGTVICVFLLTWNSDLCLSPYLEQWSVSFSLPGTVICVFLLTWNSDLCLSPYLAHTYAHTYIHPLPAPPPPPPHTHPHTHTRTRARVLNRW